MGMKVAARARGELRREPDSPARIFYVLALALNRFPVSRERFRAFKQLREAHLSAAPRNQRKEKNDETARSGRRRR